MPDDEERARTCFEAFHAQDAALRFDCLDPAARQASELDQGLLRRGAAEVLFLHGDEDAFTPENWRFWREVAVAGGLMLVSHEEGAAIEPDADWTTLRAGSRATLLQAPSQRADDGDEEALPAPRWVMGASDSLAGTWTDLLDDPAVYPIPFEGPVSGDPFEVETWPQAADLHAIDVFCDWDAEDPTGERAASQFVGFIQALVPYRIDQATGQCCVTVATRKAVFEPEMHAAARSGARVRSMAIEIGEEAKLDFRLVDLGAADDLKTLAWLARHDLRERELAVREGRLWVPRVVSNRDQYPRVPAGEDPPYRLFLDNAGQIAGLRMKTYDPPPLAPARRGDRRPPRRRSTSATSW